MQLSRTWLVAALLLIGLVPTAVWAASPQDDLAQSDHQVLQATKAIDTGDIPGAQQAYQRFRDQWVTFEDGVRDANPDQYQAIEREMRAVRSSLQAEPVDTAQVRAALQRLHDSNVQFYASATQASARQTTPNGDAPSVAAVLGELDVAR